MTLKNNPGTEILSQYGNRDGSMIGNTEAQLRARFAEDRIGQLAKEFLSEGMPFDLRELAGDRKFVVAYIDANSPYSDIPRSVETTVFAKTFEQTLAQVVQDYGKYDPSSKFATVIDITTALPTAAGALRITEYDPDLGFKDVNDLLAPESPWIDDIKRHYFKQGEDYDPDKAWTRLGETACGHRLELSESHDIATHASAEAYQGERGDLTSVSMLFYHACLRYAIAHKKENLLAIFDLKPLANLQQFGDPFDTYHGLQARPYGGPGLTLPAYGILETGMSRIRNFNEFIGQVFIDGVSLDTDALLPNEYQPDIYSNDAVGL